MLLVPDIPNAQYAATSTTAANAATGLVSGKKYLVAVTTQTMVAQGASPTAALAAGSMIVENETPVVIDGSFGAVLSARSVTGTGHITVTPLHVIIA